MDACFDYIRRIVGQTNATFFAQSTLQPNFMDKAYVLEDGVTPYVTEDGVTNYVVET